MHAQFKTREVVQLLDLSRRQLQYWAKTGLIEPSARTPGGHHRYSFDDLVALKATKRLIDAGVSVQKIRKSVRALQDLLPQVGRPLSQLVLVATGDVVLVFRDDTVFEAVSGQEWVFEVAQFEREVNQFRGIDRSMRPARDGSNRASPLELGEIPAKPGPRSAKPRTKKNLDGESSRADASYMKEQANSQTGSPTANGEKSERSRPYRTGESRAG